MTPKRHHIIDALSDATPGGSLAAVHLLLDSRPVDYYHAD